jgi:hypothetical protein
VFDDQSRMRVSRMPSGKVGAGRSVGRGGSKVTDARGQLLIVTGDTRW